MMLRHCPHEVEIKRLLALGHWPKAATPELRSHADSCRGCSDMILVSQAFHQARAVSVAAAQLPPPGVVWWRAQLRRRNAAVERINKPILGAQIFAFASTLVLAALFVYAQLRQGLPWKSWLASLTQSPAFDWKVLWRFGSSGWFKPEMSLAYLIPGLVLLALLSGVVLYLASEKE